jgi:hypothetical protein
MARYRRFDDLVSGGTVPRDAADASDPTMESVRLRRAGLKSAMSGLEIAIAAPAPGRIDEWAQGVRDALTVLQEVWTRHVVETEAPGAFLDELVEAAPRLYNQAAKLREEHNEILSVLVELDGMVPDADEPEWAHRMRGVLTNLCVALARHRQRGADLVFEAYAVDIGGG